MKCGTSCKLMMMPNKASKKNLMPVSIENLKTKPYFYSDDIKVKSGDVFF
jgi:hypothetical protein